LKKFSVISSLISGMALGIVLVSFVGCNKGSSSGSGGGDMVASINGTPITEQEFLHYMMLKPSVEVLTNKGPVEARVNHSLGFQAFTDLVKQKLVLQMAKEQNVEPTDADINKEIAFRMEDNPNFIKGLQAQGLDTDMIKQALKVELSQDNLVGKGITVSDADVDQYKKDHPQEFKQPATIDLEWILVKTPEAKKQVDEQLSHGQRFSIVASQFSEAPGAKENQGDYPTKIESQVPKEIMAEVNKVKKLQPTAWLPGSNNSGFAKFYVVNRTPSSDIKMTDHLKELVKRRIRSQRGSNAREIQTQIMEKVKQSKVDIKMAGIQATWDQFTKQLNSGALGTPSTTPTPPAAPATTAGATTAGATTSGATAGTKTTG
jgi:parvulin-like peptidyl-prolyl isomerase